MSGLTVALNANKSKTNWRARIAQCIISDFTTRLTRDNAWSCVGRDPTTGELTIDAMILPPLHDGLAMWLTDFAIAYRSVVQARYWTVAPEYANTFLKSAWEANQRPPKRSKSAQRLAAELAHQAELGAAAETWVVEYERKRLRNHPLRDQIRQVSSDDVSAGYDIVSFATALSIRHDRFIEVKSYGERKLFHWSRNEIATALEFGEEYALYLVDRCRWERPDYRPHVITGPNPEIFAMPDSGWHVEATSYEHIARSG
ncbi:MAG: DUF3883 domain-containing protein [Pseudomonadota bacterium]